MESLIHPKTVFGSVTPKIIILLRFNVSNLSTKKKAIWLRVDKSALENVNSSSIESGKLLLSANKRGMKKELEIISIMMNMQEGMIDSTKKFILMIFSMS